MKFIDTSFLIALLRKETAVKSLLKQLDKEGPHVTSTIVIHDLLVGAYGAKNPQKENEAREKAIQKLIVLNFDISAANQSAQIEAELRKEGKLIGGADILIAGTMKSRGIKTIVTHNVTHFERIKGIEVLSW